MTSTQVLDHTSHQFAKYHNYFKEHYRASFDENDILIYRRWFKAQFNFFQSKNIIQPLGRYLELGAAFGGFYQFLTKEQRNLYVGLDVDKDIVNFSNKYWNTNSFVNLGFEEYQMRNAFFDGIFAFEVLEHLENPFASINKMTTLLKKGGFFIGTSPYPYEKNVNADETHRYVLHPSNWSKLFVEAGFSSVRTYPMSFFPYIWRISERMNIRIPIYIPFRYFVSTTLIIAKY